MKRAGFSIVFAFLSVFIHGDEMEASTPQIPPEGVLHGGLFSIFQEQGPSLRAFGVKQWDAVSSSRIDLAYESLNLEGRLPDSSAPSDTYLLQTSERRFLLEAYPWIWTSSSSETELNLGVGLGVWSSIWIPKGAYNSNITYINVSGSSFLGLLGPRLLFSGRLGPQKGLNFKWEFSAQPGNLQLFLNTRALEPVIKEKSLQTLGYGSVVQRSQSELFWGETIGLTLDQSFEWLTITQLVLNDAGTAWAEAEKPETRLVLFPALTLPSQWGDLAVRLKVGYELRFQLQGQGGRSAFEGRPTAGLSLEF